MCVMISANICVTFAYNHTVLSVYSHFTVFVDRFNKNGIWIKDNRIG